MFATTRKSYVLLIVVSLAMLALATSACSFLTPRLGTVTQVVNLSLDEALFNHSVPSFEIHGHDFWDGLLVDVNRLELHDGYLRFLGTRVMPDGSRVPASIDLSLGAEQGSLTAKIIAIDIPGIKLTDPVIVEINQELETELAPMNFDLGSDVQFEQVQVMEDALQMKVKVTVRL